jgi:hypothetical protein
MSYTFAVIRKPGDTDGSLYPLLGADGETVESKQWDGDHVQLVCKGIVVKDWVDKKATQLVRLSKVPISVIVTHSRLVVTCEQWNKGGRRWGVGLGATTAPLTNLERRIKDSRESQGRLLLGHARHNWISEVGHFPRPNITTLPQLRINVKHKIDPESKPHTLTVDFSLLFNTDSLDLAKTIVKRSAEFRLEHFEVSEDQREIFAGLAKNPEFPEPVGSNYAVCRMPSSYLVTSSSAYPEK